jgi:hypothetical protein
MNMSTTNNNESRNSPYESTISKWALREKYVPIETMVTEIIKKKPK